MFKKIIAVILTLSFVALTGCGATTVSETTEEVTTEEEDLIVVGFAQVGAESDWRKANTESMKEAFTRENGYELIFSDAQQKQSNQITAIRTFIQQEVDYIVLAPVTEDGWDTVLGEAKDAGIPVIIVDRMVKVDDNSLFVCWVGSDFRLEGNKVCEWIHRYLEKNNMDESEFNIVGIQGTMGSSSQIGRSAGLRKAVGEYGWNLLAEGRGEYTQARAREVMASMLGLYKDIDAVYCENDNEAFGVIEAIEASGGKVGNNIKGGEIMVLSFDGVSDQAIEFCREGKISCIGECNPLHGPRVANIIASLEKGVSPEKYEYVDESIISTFDGITSVAIDEEDYPVTILK